GPYIYGINCLYSGAADYINNEITLGAGVTGGKNILGVMLYDSGPVKFYYNSIYISGTATSCNSIAFQRYIWTASYTTQIKNNIFYNARSGGTGTHYAIASTNSTPTVGMSSGYSNYNLFITPNSNIAALWYYTNNSFATWKSNSSCDAGSWYIASSSVNAADMFTDPGNGNLAINQNNSASWYVSGKGMPLTGYCDDFDSTGCRSTAVLSGATDIGSCEFQTQVEPVNATASGTHALNGTETFTFSGRNLCAITWGASGTLPVINYIRYHIGKNPTCTEGSYSNGYWEINTTGGSGFSYSITLYYDANMLGTISSESNIRIAKSEDNQNWIHFEGASVNTTAKTVSVSGLTSFSYFALSDQSSPMPVNINYFKAAVNRNNVTLLWQTSAEIDNAGFDVERKSKDPLQAAWQKIGNVKGRGNSTAPVDYTFEDAKLPAGSYVYRLKQIDHNGNFEYFELNEPVNITPPISFNMGQNYPNPSNPNSKIDYLLPKSGNVSIRLYDITGKEAAILVNEYKEAGYHTAVFDGANLASGVYYYSITAGEYRDTKKMILVK
ncbi:MAG: T9SS type A sorting domain-containing protein, partial [Ignavibacteria bacterium]|nr:T9SS type A sorting domain-containing protein [Ignavibacteria bacterium]